MPQFDQRRSHLVILSAGGTTEESDAESKDPDNASPAMFPAILAIPFFLCALGSSVFQRFCCSIAILF
jgi:hypothetical protein